jgi:hypothetical protein
LVLGTDGTRIPGNAFGDLIGRPPEIGAVAIVAQNPAHGPARDVAIDAVFDLPESVRRYAAPD